MWSGEQRSNHKKSHFGQHRYTTIGIFFDSFWFWSSLVTLYTPSWLLKTFFFDTSTWNVLLYLFGGTDHIKMIKVLIWRNRWKDFLQNWWIYCFVKWFINWCDFVRRQQKKTVKSIFFSRVFFLEKTIASSTSLQVVIFCLLLSHPA